MQALHGYINVLYIHNILFPYKIIFIAVYDRNTDNNN